MRHFCLILFFFTAAAYGCGPIIVLGDLTREEFPNKLGEIYDHIIKKAQAYDIVIRRPFPWREAHYADRFPTLFDMLIANENGHEFDTLFEEAAELRKNEAGILEVLLLTQQILNASMYSFDDAYVCKMNPDSFRGGIVALTAFQESLTKYFEMSDELILASFEHDSPAYFRERNELLAEWLDAVVAYLRTYVYYSDKFCTKSTSSNK